MSPYERRAQFILDGEWEEFASVDPAVDPLFARPVPHALLKRMFHEQNGKHGWIAFTGRSIRQFAKFLKKSKLEPSDKVLLRNTLLEALNEKT